MSQLDFLCWPHQVFFCFNLFLFIQGSKRAQLQTQTSGLGPQSQSPSHPRLEPDQSWEYWSPSQSFHSPSASAAGERQRKRTLRKAEIDILGSFFNCINAFISPSTTILLLSSSLETQRWSYSWPMQTRPHAVPPTKPPPLHQGFAVEIVPLECISLTPSTGASSPRLSWGGQDWTQTSLRRSRASCSKQAAAGSKASTQDHRAQLTALRGHLHYQMEGQRHLRLARRHPPRNAEYCSCTSIIASEVWTGTPRFNIARNFKMLLLDIFILINAAGFVRPVLFPWTVLLCSFVYSVIFCHS